VVPGLNQLIHMLNISCSDLPETSTAHHAQCITTDLPLELTVTDLSCTSIESKAGDHQPSNGNPPTRESTSTDTALDTRRLHTHSETSQLVVDGLDKLTQKPDGSSGENNPTGTAHHAHIPTEVQPLELLLIRTQESTSTESSDGEHQPTFGKNGTEELLDTDTAQVTEELSTSSEMLELAVTGLNKPIQLLDTSSSENNPTGIAHHAQQDIEDTQLNTLLLITEPESTSTVSNL
jgi:hypothetical protein